MLNTYWWLKTNVVLSQKVQVSWQNWCNRERIREWERERERNKTKYADTCDIVTQRLENLKGNQCNEFENFTFVATIFFLSCTLLERKQNQLKKVFDFGRYSDDITRLIKNLQWFSSLSTFREEMGDWGRRMVLGAANSTHHILIRKAFNLNFPLPNQQQMICFGCCSAITNRKTIKQQTSKQIIFSVLLSLIYKVEKEMNKLKQPLMLE